MATSGSGRAWNEPQVHGMAAAEPAVTERAAVGESPVDVLATIPEAPAASGDLERLRALLLDDERRELDAARARIAHLESAQADLPQRLTGALEAVRDERSTERLSRALAEPLARSLGTAVQRNRQPLIDALFPIIGPLIRKSIAEALRNLVADLNGAIESSFSPRGLKWRIEAWRCGVPYAQIVLKHRLAYGIDHVFLIERGSGLVLQHESAEGLAALDADAIAGMLTALGDFVGDSVGDGSGGALESMSVGEHLVWVVPGPRANLACFMRGVPPAELRALLEQRIEEIHAQWGNTPTTELRSAENHAIWHERLQPMVLLRDATAGTTPAPRAPSRWPFVLVLAALVALAWFVAGRERWHGRVDALRAQLVAHPGFVLTGIDSTPWRALIVHGLLDPDALALTPLLVGVDLGEVKPVLDLRGYVSGDDAVVARRAARLLAPPSGVRLRVSNGVLDLDGSAPDAWIASVRERADWIAGVARSEIALTPTGDAVAKARAEGEALARRLETLQVPFGDGDEMAPGGAVVVDEIVRAVQRARSLAATARVEVAFVAIGSNDETGSAATNERVRAQRARWLGRTLAIRGVPDVGVDTTPGADGPGANRRSAWLRMTVRPLAQ